ncbi:hypothetical protein [Sphingosinicella sp. BN140058]|uniref:hypothetical protein n=1 Tax=Sphingosinicella sp. BN140058 TaxID=1892855 RepID=UPI0010128F7F|nr:hypothetical protein [Sphingosinicella sp. BN140058]QAY78635.1 hypothetical protein ETR14_20400 [Sphingosinicella sp. BN140058]
MNQYSMVVLIVLIVMISTVIKARYRHGGNLAARGDDPDTLRMREELKTLRDRVAVLERIATDRENSLSRQIEELRDR